MSWIRRQKFVVAALVLYWPAIFIATHIPTIPQWVGKIPLSDKILHFSAYFMLPFLLWYAFSPTKKVSWRRPAVWLILAVIVWYGAIDEWLQGYVGRSPDVLDFAANLCGAVTGFIILSIIEFWPAALTVGATGILIVSFFLSANQETIPIPHRIVLLTCGYGIYTAIWLRYIHYHMQIKNNLSLWWFPALLLPLVLLLGIEGFCMIAGHVFNAATFITSILTIFVCVLAGYLYEVLKVKMKRNDVIES